MPLALLMAAAWLAAISEADFEDALCAPLALFNEPGLEDAITSATSAIAAITIEASAIRALRETCELRVAMMILPWKKIPDPQGLDPIRRNGAAPPNSKPGQWVADKRIE